MGVHPSVECGVCGVGMLDVESRYLEVAILVQREALFGRLMVFAVPVLGAGSQSWVTLLLLAVRTLEVQSGETSGEKRWLNSLKHVVSLLDALRVGVA